ncbi:DUF1214 domain-containing protein [Novosphingobium sp. G106]|uniref:DUF1214 domain-containing protein n=1 Tax=Novosphingobium sp. G106 TaxID=2849500 RepID=UPI001C2DD382|nr:DUF1214 domain-containing protein [Novosphingobium sp. G106]MBV1691604.1 DUF1214 domain-containing protein [Novosphingobium sp. G106]
MAFGDSPDDAGLRTAWQQFCRQLEAAGDCAFKDTIPANGLHRVDALRFLTQNLGQAFDLALETKNTQYPVIHAFCGPFRKLGGDNADFTYQQAWIDGQSVYRISGNRGTARFFNIAVQGARPTSRPEQPDWRPLHEPFGDTPEANLFGHDMAIGWDGSFEVQVGGEKPDPALCPNWLPTTPGTRKLFIRQGFDDWSELPVTMRIERIGMTEPRPMPDPAEMIAAIEWAGDFVTGVAGDWPDWPYTFAEDVDPEQVNRFPDGRRASGDPVYNPELDKKRGRAPSTMCWKLAPDEALIIEWDRNDLFWMMTNMGMSFNSMDYLYRSVSHSPARVKADSDGRIRMVLAHSDPGFHNWIDTCGFAQGEICNRNMLTDQATDFRTRVVKHDALAAAMPADSPRVTPEQRSRMMQERFHSIMRRYNF